MKFFYKECKKILFYVNGEVTKVLFSLIFLINLQISCHFIFISRIFGSCIFSIFLDIINKQQ